MECFLLDLSSNFWLCPKLRPAGGTTKTWPDLRLGFKCQNSNSEYSELFQKTFLFSNETTLVNFKVLLLSFCSLPFCTALIDCYDKTNKKVKAES